jgi:hypothetical protein
LLWGSAAAVFAVAIFVFRPMDRGPSPAALSGLRTKFAELQEKQEPGRELPAKPIPAKPPKTTSRKQPVDLSPFYNVTGIRTEGRVVGRPSGLDEEGFTFPAEVLEAMKNWSGVPFTLGPANAPDTVTSQTVALPAGKFESLRMLGTGVNGDQESQTFTVSYTDGTSASFSQSVSDWYTPGNYSGESDAAVASYRLSSTGRRDDRQFHVYGYSFGLDGKKTVKSLTLPANRRVLVFGVTLVRGAGREGALSAKELAGRGTTKPVNLLSRK